MWRKTPQTTLVSSLLKEHGHLTNQELGSLSRKVFPDITNTSIHRITTRLVNAGMAAYAPSLHNRKVIDANTERHEHFMCLACEKLVDIHLSDSSIDAIQDQLPGKVSRKNILITGTCERCM